MTSTTAPMSNSNTTAPVSPPTSAPTAVAAAAARHAAPTVTDAQDWSSVVLDYALRFELVTLDISSHRILYHLKLELEQPIPSAYLEFTNYLCLGWPLGGIWKITKRCDENRFLTCVAWRETELSASAIAELMQKYAPTPAADSDATPLSSDAAGTATLTRACRPPRTTLFDWKLQLGTWKHRHHWCVREVGVPPAYATTYDIPSDTLLTATLFAGLEPVEVSMVVNSISAVDTVAQRFTADVTWELTLRGITTMREDAVLRELLGMLEFKEHDLEFTNITDVHTEKPLVAVLSQEGERIQFIDPFVSTTEATVAQRVHQLKYSRRIVAEFSEEMALYSFPFDQQKLTFTFNMGKSLAPFIPITPRSGDPGRFALETFKLRNVWLVVCGDKLFVGDVVDAGASKRIRFELTLERRSAYYLTNVGLPAAIITYLCFLSYAPLKISSSASSPSSTSLSTPHDNAYTMEMMDTSARLQIVLTLLLTAVTFKYNLASLIPQVSYFTTLDKYVFVCFIITCVVAVENAMYPLVAQLFGDYAGSWKEYSLGWFSVATFTLMNVVWGLYLANWIRKRNARTRVLLLVVEYVRAIATAIPNDRKRDVLCGFLETLEFDATMLPQFVTTTRGDLFVKLPSDAPVEDASKSPFEATSSMFRKQALRDLPAIQRYFRDLDPTYASPASSPAPSPTHATVVLPPSPSVAGVAAVVAKQYGAASVVVNVQDDKQAQGA